MSVKTIEIKTKSSRSRWVALSMDKKHTILSEGVKPEVVIKKAIKTGKEFTVEFVPDPNSCYIL
jgi:hypothetical protein